MNSARKDKIEGICTTAVRDLHALFSDPSTRGPMFTWESWVQHVGEDSAEWLNRNPPSSYPRKWSYEEYQYAASYSTTLARMLVSEDRKD